MVANCAKSPFGVIPELTDFLDEKASELRLSESSASSPIPQWKKKSRFSAQSTSLRLSSDGKSLEQESVHTALIHTKCFLSNRPTKGLQKNLKVHHSTMSMKDTSTVLASVEGPF